VARELPPIIDPHVHFWQPWTTPRRVTPLVRLLGWSRRLTRAAARAAFPRAANDFVGRPDFVTADHLPATYLRDAEVDVTGVVHVEAGWEGRDVAQETAWLEGLDDRGLILGIVGAAELGAPDLDARLDRHAAASRRFVGVRDKLACSPRRGLVDWAHDPGALTDAAWIRGYARLAERGLTFDAWMYSPQLPAFRDVAAAHPGTRVVVDHVGTPVGLGGPFGGLSHAERADLEARWRDDLAALAELPHVHLKLSGLTMPIVGFGLHDGPPVDAAELAERIGPPYRYALECFGTERCMFGSNFPVDKVSTSMGTLYAVFDEITADLSDEARAALFAGNARRFYGLSIPGGE